jgi:HEAT repeat protein
MTTDSMGLTQPPDLHDEESYLDGAAIQEEELRQANTLVSALVKAIKAFRYYPPEYPLLKHFYQDLVNRFTAYLREYYSLVIKIDENKFSVKDHVLYATKDLKSSVPFLLYRDGVRQLRFMDGLEEWELKSFLDLLVQSDNIDHLDDDIVTLLWENDYIHIDYLAVDDYLDDVEIVIPENVEEFRDNQPQAALNHQVEINLANERGEDALQQPQMLGDFSALATNKDIYMLTPEDLDALRQEVTTEIAPNAVYATATLLCDVCPLESDAEVFKAAIDILRNILETMLGTHDFPHATEVLMRLRLLLADPHIAPWQATLVSELQAIAAAPERIDAVRQFLQADGDNERTAEFKRYLVQMPPLVVPQLVRILPQVPHDHARQMLTEVLAEVAEPAPEALSRFLDDPNGVLVRYLTRALGLIGGERVLGFLAKAFSHHDFSVRLEVLAALQRIPGAGAERLLVRALGDAEESVRGQAALGLGDRRTQTALAPLLHAVRAKGFRRRSPGEIKAFFEGIGRTGFNDALEALKEALTKRIWFGRGNLEAVRMHSARALVMLGTAEARAVLLEYSTARDATIKRACEQAMKGSTRDSR